MKNLKFDHEITTILILQSVFIFYALHIRIIRKSRTCILKCIITTEFDIIFSKSHDLITNNKWQFQYFFSSILQYNIRQRH